jgi:hypothetical protein
MISYCVGGDCLPRRGLHGSVSAVPMPTGDALRAFPLAGKHPEIALVGRIANLPRLLQLVMHSAAHRTSRCVGCAGILAVASQLTVATDSLRAE